MPPQKTKQTTLFFFLGASLLLLLLKLAPANFIENAIQTFLTFLPFLIICIVTTKGYLQYKSSLFHFSPSQSPNAPYETETKKTEKREKTKKIQKAIRKESLQTILSLLAITLLFYILYSPASFKPILTAVTSFSQFLSVETAFLLLSYFSIFILIVFGISLTIRYIQIKREGNEYTNENENETQYQNQYQNQSQNPLKTKFSLEVKRSLYALFFIFFFLLASSALAYPTAYTPITTALTEGITSLTESSPSPNTLSFGQSLAKTYNNLKSNITQSNDSFTQNVKETKDLLDKSLARTTKDLHQTLTEDIEDKLNITGGTLTSDLTIEGDLDIEDLLTTRDILPESDGTYDIGSPSKGYESLYISRIYGSSPVTVGDGSSSHSLTSEDDLIISGDLEINGTLYADGVLTLANDPTQSLHAATKQYVDNQIGSSSFLERVGTTISPKTAADSWDFENGILQNIGNAGTDFTTLGGLTLAGTLTVSTNQLVVDTSTGNVGVGTTTPLYPLHVAGQCVTADTRLRRRRKRRKEETDEKLKKANALFDEAYVYDEVMIKNVRAGDEVASIDPIQGTLAWRKVNGVLDMGKQKIYKITTVTGKSIKTTANHPYFRLGRYDDNDTLRGIKPKTQKLYRFEVDQSIRIEQYSKDTVVAIANAENVCTVVIPNEIKRHLRDSLRALSPKHFAPVLFATAICAAIKQSPFRIHELRIDVEYTNYEDAITKVIRTAFPDMYIHFSLVGKKSPAHYAAYGVHKKQKTADYTATRETFAQNAENALLTVTPPHIRRTIRSLTRASLDASTIADTKNPVKPVKQPKPLNTAKGMWAVASALSEGEMIAVTYSDAIVWEKIKKIKKLPPEHVYDIEIDGTHNFIANDIVAHNTYINGAVTIASGGASITGNSTITGTLGGITTLSSTTLTAGTANLTTANLTTLSSSTVLSSDDAYDASSWNGNVEIPTKNALRDKIESMLTGSGINHGGLTGLADDDHTQYALLAGRSGGQTLIGGTAITDGLTLQTTSGVGATGADMHFLVGNNGATEAMTILNSGNVGIGTTSPGTPLMVATNANHNGIRVWRNFNGIGGGYQGLLLALNNNVGTVTDYASIVPNIISNTAGVESGRISFYTRNAGALGERVTIQNTGNIGIGTTSPDQALDVIGTIQASNLLGGAVNLTTDASGNIIRDPSDKNFKENITHIENALDTILNLRGVKYEWKDKDRFGSQTEIGFIAQELQEFVPEIVRTGGEYLSINTRNLTALNLEAIKELSTKYELRIENSELGIAQYESRIAENEEGVQDLKSHIQDLTSQLSLLREDAAEGQALLTTNYELLTDENQAIIDFFTSLNPDSLVYKDIQGNLTLTKGATLTIEDGKVIAKNIEAQNIETDSLVAGAFTIKTNPENSNAPILGTATIPEGETSVIVETEAVGEDVSVFVSFEGNPNAYNWVEKIEESGAYTGFSIHLSELAEKDLSVNCSI